MAKKAVIDSGPLIALFDKDDKYHKKAVKFIKNFDGQLISTLPVITEVCHLLDFNIQTQIDFLTWVKDGALNLTTLSTDDFTQIIKLTQKYSDIPMDFADASLVVISENLNIRDIISVDKDFLIYRHRNGKAFLNIFL